MVEKPVWEKENKNRRITRGHKVIDPPTIDSTRGKSCMMIGSVRKKYE